MPYSGKNDPDLPSNIKKLPDRLRSQWVKVWNSTHARCTEEGGEDCEGMAFRVANGIVKKRMEGREDVTKQFQFIDMTGEVDLPGKPFDGVAPGEFEDMYGRDVVIKEADLQKYVDNTKQAIEFLRSESGGVLGLPIDAQNHDKGDAAGWITDVFLAEVDKPDGKKMNVIRFVARWTEVGKELISKGIRKLFSPTLDLKNKVILGGSLTNWPASRDGKQNVLLRPVEMSSVLVISDLQDDDDESYDEKIRDVYEAWNKMHPVKHEAVTESPGWVTEVFDDYCIVSRDGDYFKVPYERTDDGIEFADFDDWVKVRKDWIEAMRDMFRRALNLGEPTELAKFDNSPWDAGAVRRDLTVADLRKVSLLDLNGYPGQDEPVKGLCYLPIRKSPGSAPNRNALRATASGARGIGAVKKPADVPQDWFAGRRKAAANKIISMWRGAFDKPAPASIYKIAGKSPPAEAEQEFDTADTLPQEVLDMDVQELESLIAKTVDGAVAKLVTKIGAPPDQLPPGDDRNPDAVVDLVKLLNLEHLEGEAQERIESALAQHYEQIQKQAEETYLRRLAQVTRKRDAQELATRVTIGSEEYPYALPIQADQLAEALLRLPQDQAGFWNDLVQKVAKDGIVEFAEIGNEKRPQGTGKLPAYFAEKLDSGELTLVDLRSPLLVNELGDLAQYDLSAWNK